MAFHYIKRNTSNSREGFQRYCTNLLQYNIAAIYNKIITMKIARVYSMVKSLSNFNLNIIMGMCIPFASIPAEKNYSMIIHKTDCPRLVALAQLGLFPAVIVKLIKEYDFLSPLHRVDHESPATAFAILPHNRMVIANRKNRLSIINYMTGKILHTWQSLQREVDQIDTVVFSQDPEDVRIISIAPVTCNMRIWDGQGNALYSSINRYACNPFNPMLSTFDAMFLATSHLGNGFILSRLGTPFDIPRADCKHILYLTPTNIIAGFRSGKIEHWRYKFRSPSILWQQTILNENRIKKSHQQPVTALCKISENRFLVGFPHGIIEEWSINKGMQKAWQAHEESIKNIKIFNNEICLTTAGKILKTWQLPGYEEATIQTFHAPIAHILATNNPCSTNYVIVCFEEEPLQVWSC